MGKDAWKVMFHDTNAEGGVATRLFGEDERSARFWAGELNGRLYRKEAVGDDDGLMAMSNPDAYDWAAVP